MSDNWLVIVPLDPYEAPNTDAVEEARGVVERAFPDADEVIAESAPNPQFVDAGSNFERVSVLQCGHDSERLALRVVAGFRSGVNPRDESGRRGPTA